ncbi:MAG: DNA helicase RecQ [Gammaproteobacteria bacterium]
MATVTAATSDAALARARDLLREVYGYADFRGEQAGAIAAALAGRDVVVLMPTGGGKSLCYQLPPLASGGLALVVSPLIALMHDQVGALEQLGVAAGCLNSAQSAAEQAAITRALAERRLRVLYCAPERVQQPRTLALLKDAGVSLIAIDEAHCVSQWGHDFRQDYLTLDALAAHFPGVPRMALTATADERTRADIAARLALVDPAWFVGGFDRPNIRYAVRARVNEREQLKRFLASHAGAAGIVYCMSRKKVETIASWLDAQGIAALPYHAGLDDLTRRRHQERFLREDGIVMVATIAFGMGIDKPDVRFVAHLDLPKSVEAYYQETGRAGRDGEPADAWMVYGLQDVVRLRQMLDASSADDEHKRIERHKLDALLGWCEATTCRRLPLLEYFGERRGEPCGNCDNCLEPPRTFDATEDAQKLLSCIYRTGQRFGAAHVIDVLRGADTEKVRQHRHDALSTFGIGAGQGNDHWRSLLRQLMVTGAVWADVEGYGALRLGEQARGILRGEHAVRVREDRGETKAAGRRRATSVPDTIDPADEPLWERLRECRKRLADEQGVPPYVIFHDRTLRDMLARRPGTLAEMLEVSGVGEAKLERYGAAFLDALAGD